MKETREKGTNSYQAVPPPKECELQSVHDPLEVKGLKLGFLLTNPCGSWKPKLYDISTNISAPKAGSTAFNKHTRYPPFQRHSNTHCVLSFSTGGDGTKIRRTSAKHFAAQSLTFFSDAQMRRGRSGGGVLMSNQLSANIVENQGCSSFWEVFCFLCLLFPHTRCLSFMHKPPSKSKTTYQL